MTLQVYLNGEYIPQDEARISVLDRGFLFGDGVYEVIPVYAGKLFRFEQHIERLNNSLSAILMEPPHSLEEWRTIAEKLIAQLPGKDQAVYLQVTRGATSKRDHAIPVNIEPTRFVMTRAAKTPDPSIKDGLTAITLDDIRWKHCNIKAITLLANVLAKHQASEDGADEAILIRNDKAMEGSASNLFIVRDGLVITPPKSDFLLPGITRDLAIELAQEAGIPYCEAEISKEDLQVADEIWITSSTKEIAPIISLDNKRVGDGKPGPVWQKINAHYDACKERLRLHGECR